MQAAYFEVAALSNQSNPSSQRRRRLPFIIAGLAALAGVIFVAAQLSDISAFARQAAAARPKFLGAAALAQLATYGGVAFVWFLVLRAAHARLPYRQLYPLSIAKLFADQAAPSAGVSGAVFFLHALGRRGVAHETAFAVFVFATASFFAAFFFAAMISLFALARADNTPPALVASIAGFAGFVLFLLLIVYAGFITRAHIPNALKARFPLLRKAAEWLTTAAGYISAQRKLFLEATLIQFAVRLIDGVTLFLLFEAIGAPAPYSACFFAVVIASVAATLGPMPMGLGAFEAGMISSLVAFSAPIEDAVTATLLFRGLSLWAPLLPGFYIIQREILKPPSGSAE